MTKRKTKKGYVYILKQHSCDNKQTIYKYGCSTNLKSRIKNINSTNKFKAKFKELMCISSKDMFGHECLFKWRIWNFCLNSDGEYFWLDEDISESDIIKAFKGVFND